MRMLFAAFVSVTVAYSCDTVTIGRHPHKVDVAKAIVKRADLIVRATAIGYAMRPQTTQMIGSIRFEVTEVIKGRRIAELVLKGELVDFDDFNETPQPYQSARPNADRGSCWAWQYKTGAQYLLILEKDRTRGLTAEWYPRAPVNEQLHSDEDPWLLWVRTRAKAR
jgi:hypothetical protein